MRTLPRPKQDIKDLKKHLRNCRNNLKTSEASNGFKCNKSKVEAVKYWQGRIEELEKQIKEMEGV